MGEQFPPAAWGVDMLVPSYTSYITPVPLSLVVVDRMPDPWPEMSTNAP